MRNMVWLFLLININTTIGLFITKVSFLVLILFYIWMGYQTDAELIFYVLSLFTQINSQFGFALPNYFSKIVQLSASLFRLENVLQAEELKRSEENCYGDGEPLVLLKDVCYSLNNEEILKGVSLHVSDPGLYVITGPVGSGKSSLLKVILLEYHPVTEGKNIYIN